MIQQVRRKVNKQDASGDEANPADVHESGANLLRGHGAVYADIAGDSQHVRLGRAPALFRLTPFANSSYECRMIDCLSAF